MSSSQNRRQMMQPWPLCLVSFGKSKDRAILPKQYSRVPSIARTSGTSTTLAEECASNTTLLTNVSPFNSQVALIADKRSAAHRLEAASGSDAKSQIQSLDQDLSSEARSSGQQQHYYAENLRNNHHRTLNGSQIYDPLLKDREVDYRQIDPLLSKDVTSSDVKILMESQDFKKPEGVVRMAIPQFDNEKVPKKKQFLFQVLAAFSVSLGSLVVGFTTSYTSPAIASMQNSTDTPFEVTPEVVSWIGSIMPLSALFGGIAGGPLIEYLGRRNTILFSAIPFFFAWILISFTTHLYMMLAGRALSGFCVGVASLSLPVYLGETIQPEVRGSLGLLPTALGNIGILVCFTVGMYLNWWQLALFGAALPVPFGLLMLLIPETPRWYISKGKTKRARESLQWLRGRDTDVSDELTCIEKIHVESERQATQGAIRDLFRGNNFKPLLISLGLMFFQQMSGINAVIFYTVQIFSEAGSSIDSNLSTIIVGIVNFGSTFVASALIDRLGRKILLYMSSVSMILSLLILGSFFYVREYNLMDVQSLGWLPLTSFVVYVIGFSLGFGPIPWLMMGEILPAKIRGSAASIATGFNWSCTFIVTKTFMGMLKVLGLHGAFWVFGFICLAGLFFVVLFVPETSGKSLEEIERGLTGPVRRTSAVANLRPTPMAC